MLIRVAAAQINPVVGDFSGNERIILDAVKSAVEKQADIVAFPELAVCGYPPEDLIYRDHFVSDNKKSITSIAKQINNVTAIIGFVDKDKHGNIYNAAAVIQNGAITGVYHKENLPNYGVFDEKRYFTPGSVKNKVFTCKGVSFGVSICEDIWYSDSIIKAQKGSGAHLHFNISASPYHIGKIKERMKMLSERAKKCSVFICYSNIVGGQDELVFDGGSTVFNKYGKIISSAQQFKDYLLFADINMKNKSTNAKRSVKLAPAKAGIDMHKATALSLEAEVYNALVLGTRDYVRKNGFKKVVIGLSGGIDSSIVACIAVDAIGKENVIGITMPTRYTSDQTNIDAKKLSGNLGITLHAIPIENIYKAYLSVFQTVFNGYEQGTAEENIQARIRGNILMAFSNKFGWMVLTTGNKSETSVGYCTLYGDTAGGFAVIKDVPKTLIYKISYYRNSIHPVIPQSVLEKAPTAELKFNQKDTDSLPEYSILDPILKEYVENDKSYHEIIKSKYDPKTVARMLNMVDKSEYKRRQSPPGVKITQKAFGKDRRIPITNRYTHY